MRFDKSDYILHKLNEICDILGGYPFDSNKMKNSGAYQIVKMGNLYNGNLDLSRNPAFYDSLTGKEQYALLRKGDIAITLTGTQGKKDYGYSVFIDDDKNLLLNQRCGLIRVKKNCYEKYLYYYLKTDRFKTQFYNSSIGGTGNQTNVSIKSMNDFLIMLPEYEIQRKTSEFLYLVDNKITTQSKIIDDYKSLIRNFCYL